MIPENRSALVHLFSEVADLTRALGELLLPPAITLRLKRLLNEVIKPTARKLGIPEVGWKMLRRWNSTVMNEEHFSDRVRQTRLGHASPIVTNEHYTVVRDSVSRRAAEAIDRRLEESRKNSSKNVGTPEAVGV